jgi:hypothetical protein
VTHHLLGVAEIAELLELSPDQVRRLARDDPEFPPPEANLHIGRVWSTMAVEQWRDEHPRQPNSRRLSRTDYAIDLAGFDRLERPRQVILVRLEVEIPGRIVPFERQLPVKAADRIMELLKQESVKPARAERSLRWALAHQAAAALGREIERARDLNDVPATKLLAKGHQARITAAARQAAERQLSDIKVGTLLRVSAF